MVAISEEEQARKLHEARLRDLARVNARIARTRERFRVFETELADLEATRQDILDALSADPRPPGSRTD